MSKKVTIPAELREELAGANGDPVVLCDDAGNVVGYAVTPGQFVRLTPKPEDPWTPEEIARPKQTVAEVLSSAAEASPATYPEPTPADHEAMFWSVVWFRQQQDAGRMDGYIGKHVAILGERVLDADRDQAELVRRVDALGDAVCQSRVVLQYFPTWEESRLH